MRNVDLIEKLKGGLIVSCQVFEDEPIYTPDLATVMAKAALWAGAVGIRANSPEQIRAIKKEVDLPVIGLFKVWSETTSVYITPTIEAVDLIVEAGADIVAVDATFRLNENNQLAVEIVKKIRDKYPHLPIFADVATLEEAIMAVNYGATIVAPTLFGYTEDTSIYTAPDFRLLSQMVRSVNDRAYVFMEGSINTPEEAMKALFLGAHSVVVGGAITRPHLTAKRFVDLINKYDDK